MIGDLSKHIIHRVIKVYIHITINACDTNVHLMEVSTTMDDTNSKRETRIRRILENSENRLRMITSRCNEDEIKDTMNETNVKREARRRKILENSENRFHKIGAKYNSDETKADNLLWNESFVENDSFKSNLAECTVRNGTCNFEDNRNLQYTGFNENEHRGFHTKFNEDRYNEPDERFSSDTNDRYTCTLEEVLDKKSISCTYLPYHMNLIVLAAIVNILLILRLDDWFGKMIFVPYLLLMMTGRWHDFKKLQKTKSSSFMNAVSTVIFSKTKSDLICKLEALYILCNMIISDFCLYMFSFVLMRYIHTICYYYYHVLLHT